MNFQYGGEIVCVEIMNPQCGCEIEYEDIMNFLHSETNVLSACRGYNEFPALRNQRFKCMQWI